MALLV